MFQTCPVVSSSCWDAALRVLKVRVLLQKPELEISNLLQEHLQLFVRWQDGRSETKRNTETEVKRIVRGMQ